MLDGSSYCQPLSVISLADTEQSFEGIVSRNDKASQVGQDLSTKVEEDKEEVETDDSEKPVDLWNRGLLLEIVDDRVFGQLSYNQHMLGWLPRRACCTW